MKTEEQLRRASREQLIACARLLALNVAQHRIKFAAVPLEESLAHTSREAHDSASRALRRSAEQAIGEALDLAIRQQEREALAEAERAAGLLSDRRRHMRISVSARAELACPVGGERVAVRLENISWGGASVRADSPLAKAGDEVDLIVPAPGKPIHILAQVLRVGEADRTYLLALRFLRLSSEDEEALQEVLLVLAKSKDGGEQREHPRLAQRLDIEFGDTAEMHASLEDISAGGFSVTVPNPLELHQSLQVALGTLDGECNLVLRARVVRQQVVNTPNMDLYRVGLQFEHPPEDIQERIERLLENIVIANRPHAS